MLSQWVDGWGDCCSVDNGGLMVWLCRWMELLIWWLVACGALVACQIYSAQVMMVDDCLRWWWLRRGLTERVRAPVGFSLTLFYPPLGEGYWLVFISKSIGYNSWDELWLEMGEGLVLACEEKSE